MIPGTPVFNRRINSCGNFNGHIVKSEKAHKKEYLLIGGKKPLDPINEEITIVWTNNKIETIPAQYVDKWLATDETSPHLSIEDCNDLYAQALKIQEDARKAHQQEQRQKLEKQEKFEAYARTLIPDGTKAVIVAELKVNDSDLMSDYFASHNARAVAIAWSKTTRNSFPEMRKAALTFKPTEDMADPERSREERYRFHLEELSGNSHSGWHILKYSIGSNEGNSNFSIPFDEISDHLTNVSTNQTNSTKPSTQTQPDNPSLPGKLQLKITDQHNDKRNFDYRLITLETNIPRKQFLDLLERCKTEFGGWYARPFKDIPSGFAFKDFHKADQFAKLLQS